MDKVIDSGKVKQKVPLKLDLELYGLRKEDMDLEFSIDSTVPLHDIAVLFVLSIS